MFWIGNKLILKMLAVSLFVFVKIHGYHTWRRHKWVYSSSPWKGWKNNGTESFSNHNHTNELLI